MLHLLRVNTTILLAYGALLLLSLFFLFRTCTRRSTKKTEKLESDCEPTNNKEEISREEDLTPKPHPLENTQIEQILNRAAFLTNEEAVIGIVGRLPLAPSRGTVRIDPVTYTVSNEGKIITELEIGKERAVGYAFEFGGNTLKHGDVSQDLPKKVRSVYGLPKIESMRIESQVKRRSYVGSTAVGNRSVLELKPIVTSYGKIDCENMERLIEDVTTSEIDWRSTPVIIAEHSLPLNNNYFRSKLASIFLEQLQVPSIAYVPDSVLTLASVGKTTGLVVDAGESATKVTAVYEGIALRHLTQTTLGGRQLDDIMRRILLAEFGQNLFTSSEKEIVKEIKEKHAFVHYDPDTSLADALLDSAYSPRKYTLPDGNEISLGSATVKTPEFLFNPTFNPEITSPDFRSIQELTLRVVQNVNDVTQGDSRFGLSDEVLLSNIVLSGGTSLMTNFAERYCYELKDLVIKNCPNVSKMNMTLPKDRLSSVFAGAKVFAQHPLFATDLSITNEEYFESGLPLLGRVCL